MDDVTINAAEREQAVPQSKRGPSLWIIVISAVALIAGIVTAAFYLT